MSISHIFMFPENYNHTTYYERETSMTKFNNSLIKADKKYKISK
jgi:hypothetical protein